MHPQAATRPEIEMCSHRFLWIHVVLPHEPSWLVSPNRKQRQINVREPAPDFGKVRTVAGVACEIDDRFSDLDDESTPKTAIPVVQSA